MDNYNFEEFKSVGGRYNMVITLGKSERFYLGGAFCRKYDIASMAGVKLMFDRNKLAVGFKFVKETQDGMINLKKLPDNSYYINAKAFLGMYDIPAGKYSHRYTPTEIPSNDANRIFVITLKEKSVDLEIVP